MGAPEASLESGSLLDPLTFGADVNQTSSPLERCPSRERPLPFSLSSESSSSSSSSSEELEKEDLSYSQPDSMTYSPRGYFYYLSTFEDSSVFCRGSPSLQECSQELPSSDDTSCCFSSLDGSGKDEASGEADVASMSESGDAFQFEEGSLTP